MKVAGLATTPSGDLDLGGLAEQLAVHVPSRTGFFRQGLNEMKPGIVPGPGVFRSGVAQTDDQSQSCHGSFQYGACRGQAP
jgi:hypothetical protein